VPHSLNTVLRFYEGRDRERRADVCSLVVTGVFEDVYKNLLIHVGNGCLTDPKGVPLYETVSGLEWHGLPVLRCLRCSSHAESIFSGFNDLLAGSNTKLETLC
jgi:hypothetical protein